MQDCIAMVATLVQQGYASTDEIHDRLLAFGLTEEQAFLTFQAGKLLAKTRETTRLSDEPCPSTVPSP
jgi:hypothetical protein